MVETCWNHGYGWLWQRRWLRRTDSDGSNRSCATEEMALFNPEVRRRTDALDAAGNTTAAIGKAPGASRQWSSCEWSNQLHEKHQEMTTIRWYWWITSIYINTMVVIKVIQVIHQYCGGEPMVINGNTDESTSRDCKELINNGLIHHISSV